MISRKRRSGACASSASTASVTLALILDGHCDPLSASGSIQSNTEFGVLHTFQVSLCYAVPMETATDALFSWRSPKSANFGPCGRATTYGAAASDAADSDAGKSSLVRPLFIRTPKGRGISPRPARPCSTKYRIYCHWLAAPRKEPSRAGQGLPGAGLDVGIFGSGLFKVIPMLLTRFPQGPTRCADRAAQT